MLQQGVDRWLALELHFDRDSEKERREGTYLRNKLPTKIISYLGIIV